MTAIPRLGDVFAALIGQERVVVALRAAVDAAGAVGSAAPIGTAMTHAWLFTGPPGSGRSVAARAFAAALECPQGGCGSCLECRTALAGSHADVEIVRPDGLSIGVRDTRELVRRAAGGAVRGRWRVLVVEDADRLTEGAANVLLKSIEEPPPRTVWLLCVPSAEDVPPTIRSRCRLVRLGIPRAEAVAEMLVARDGVDRPVAAFAARAAQGHVGRARRLALDEAARRRRLDVLAVPTAIGTVPACVAAAEQLDAAAREEADAFTGELAAEETAGVREAFGDTGGRTRPRGLAGALRELEGRQRSRVTRSRRDAVDRALVDLAAFYRDVLIVQLGARVPAIHPDLADTVGRLARTSSPETSLRRLQAIIACRAAIEANVAPQLALEAMTLELTLAGHPASG